MKKLALLPLTIATTLTATEIVKPNIVIFYGDDVGYGDVGAYGAKKIPTPNLDNLVKKGVIFTNAHSTASTSTPSRFSLLTGVHGFREKVAILPGDAKMAISTEALTIPKLLKQANYTTAVIGKWHLGLGDGKKKINWNQEVSPGPNELGFDYSFILPATNDRVPCVYLRNKNVINLDLSDPISVDYHRPIEGSIYPDGKKDRSAMTYYESSHGHNNSVINGIGRIGYMAGGQKALWNDENMADVLVNEAKSFID
ncbi:MAG: sulfatase-like hydrolase/transferase, partial [Lentisphaeria bacterium]